MQLYLNSFVFQTRTSILSRLSLRYKTLKVICWSSSLGTSLIIMGYEMKLSHHVTHLSLSATSMSTTNWPRVLRKTAMPMGFSKRMKCWARNSKLTATYASFTFNYVPSCHRWASILLPIRMVNERQRLQRLYWLRRMNFVSKVLKTS